MHRHASKIAASFSLAGALVSCGGGSSSSSASSPSSSPPPALSASATWLEENAKPFSSTDPDNTDFSDLEIFGNAFGNARIVSLGEPSHGNGTVFDHKVRLIKYLHEKKGFDVLMYEAGIFGTLRMAQLMQNGASLDAIATGELADSYANSVEGRRMLSYIDSQRTAAFPLLLAGMDSHQSGKYARTDLIPMLGAYLSSKNSSLPQSADWPNYRAQVQQLTQNNQTAPAASAQTAFYSFSSALEAELCASQPDSFTFPDSPGQWCRIAKSLHNQADRFWQGKINRDVDMAENAKWLMENTFQGHKVIIWTHIDHANRLDWGGDYGLTMGQVLANAYGNQMYVMSYTASTGTSLNVFSHVVYDIPADLSGSVEAILHGMNQPLLFIDARTHTPPAGAPLPPVKDAEYAYPQVSVPGGYFAYDGLVYMYRADAVTLNR